jgi:hypothetical protein
VTADEAVLQVALLVDKDDTRAGPDHVAIRRASSRPGAVRRRRR